MKTENTLKTQVREYTHRVSHGGSRTTTSGIVHRIARGTARAATLALLAGMAFASQQLYAASNSLVDITHVTLPGNKQQLALTLSGPAQTPKTFTIDNPARIALDLPDTSNDLEDRRIAISSGMLQNVTTVEAGGRTRVVINLTALTPYTTSVRGNQLLVTLDSSGNASQNPPTWSWQPPTASMNRRSFRPAAPLQSVSIRLMHWTSGAARWAKAE